MVEDQDSEIDKTEYLPFLSLIKGPDYQYLFSMPTGIKLYKEICRNFGVYDREPYVSPRAENRVEYHKSIC